MPINLIKEEVNAERLSPAALAFVGDAVYSLAVRTMLAVSGDLPANTLHNRAAQLVAASAQAAAAGKILPLLSEKESDIFRRGRNMHTIRTPKSSSTAEYHAATALECLMGYLYLKNQHERIDELLKVIFSD